MKKLISLTLAIILAFSALALFSCTEEGNVGETVGETVEHEDTAPADFTEIRVAVLNGTTGFGIAPLYSDIQSGNDHNMNAKIDFYADATLVAPLVIGGSVDIAAGEKVTISRGEFPIKSISINNNFIAALNQKLLWGEDKRNVQ